MKMRFALPRFRRLSVAARGLALVSLLSWGAFAVPVAADAEPDYIDPTPKRLDGVEIRERLGEALPLDLQFTDSDGVSRRLGDLINGTRTTILTFNYSDCPMLCSLQLNGLVAGLKQVTRTAGDDFQIITVSIDPAETLERATQTKQRYLRDYGRPEAASGWHFLLSPEAKTRQLADAAGFGYTFNEARKEWLHTAAAVVVTPEGKIARYLYGIEYHPETLNLSVVEASEGRIGSTVDKLLLYCFHYDESEGRYAPVAMNIMRVGAGGVAVLLGAFLAYYWTAERRKARARRAVAQALSASDATHSSSFWPPATEPKRTES
ncbi:MAG: hypothetical protein RJA70_2879 [Pseudomonadota bacterium]|jgi:protein SCO1/2